MTLGTAQFVFRRVVPSLIVATSCACLQPSFAQTASTNESTRERARAKDFDVVGEIACAQNKGEQLGTCRIGVARDSDGGATAIVTFQNSFARELYFEGGAFVRANATMSGVGRDVDWSIADNTYYIRVDDQRFEIPKGFVSGK